MSDEILEPENEPAAQLKSSGKLSPASIIGLALLLAVILFGGYVASFWIPHNSRISRLKARNGDYVQLMHRGDFDEFGGGGGGGGGGGRRNSNDSEEPKETPEPKEPTVYEQYMKELFPQPIQVVYWKDQDLKPDDVELLMQFQDAEVMNVNCREIQSKSIERLLELPNLRRLKIQSEDLDISSIKNWKLSKKIVQIQLVNGKWKSADMDEVRTAAESNKPLAEKLQVSSQTGPSFGAS